MLISELVIVFISHQKSDLYTTLL